MTRRLYEKLPLALLLARPTRFLSLKLVHLSLSTLHLCRSLARALASRTLALFTMDDNFFFSSSSSASASADDLWDLDSHYRFRPQRRLLDEDDDDDDANAVDKVYLVPYRYFPLPYFLFVFGCLAWLPRKRRKNEMDV
jgi:hypothetical protein